MSDRNDGELTGINEERLQILEQLEDWLEVPMLVLGFAWLVLFIVEVVWGLGAVLSAASNVIWVIFIIDFLVRFTLAPYKWRYLKANWLTAISLAAPALRLLRIARLAQLMRLSRVTRGLRLLRTISSVNRGMRALSATMRRRGFGYVVGITLIVALAGAAGMLAFENDATLERGIHSYGDALWWTAMALTTVGTDYSPLTPEGRILSFIIALFSFAVFGYVTATLATFFVGRDAQNSEGEVAGSAELRALEREMVALRDEIRTLAERLGGAQPE